MCSNKQLDKKVTIAPTWEPVSLEEAKLYMVIDYAEKDTIIAALITAARELLEEKYDIGIALKTLNVIIDNSCGGFELTGSPIGAVTGVDSDGNNVELTIIGEHHKYVESPCSCYLKLTYTSGFEAAETVPLVFRNAIKEQVLWMLEHLGDEVMEDTICPMAVMSLKPYRRNGTGVFL